MRSIKTRAGRQVFFAALSENNSSGKLLAVPVVLLGQSRAQATIAQPRSAGGVPAPGPAAEGDTRSRDGMSRAGGGGVRGRTRQRGYFWCCVHIVLVPVFRLYRLLDLVGLPCVPHSVQMSQGRDRGGRERSLCGRMFGGKI